MIVFFVPFFSPHATLGSFHEAEEYAVEGKIATLSSVGLWHAANLSAPIVAVAGCLLMLYAGGALSVWTAVTRRLGA